MILIKNGKILVNSSFTDCSLIIDNGKIKAIVKDEKPFFNKVDEIIDAKNLPIIPGGIDIHAHIYDPDYVHHEDFKTGSTAAAFGGLTTIFDMPLRLYVDDVNKLMLKINEGRKNSLVNFGIHAGMMNEKNWVNIKYLAKQGVIGYKVFTCKPFKSSSEGIVKVMEEVKKYNRVVYVHAEDDVLIDLGLRSVRGRHDPLAHHEARSDSAEASAINWIIFAAKEIGVHVHIAHVSSALGAKVIKMGKSLGINLTAETCPQYLFFTREDVEKYGNYLKITPSLKTKRDVRELWDAVANRTIDAIASDHAPSPPSEKEVNVWEAWGGIPVLELIIPFTYTFGVLKNIISFKRFIELISENPAKIMHIFPKKGSLSPGSDADITILNINKCKEVKGEELHHKVNWTPFEGVKMCGWPLHVFVNGIPVILDETLVGKPGIGKFVGIL